MTISCYRLAVIDGNIGSDTRLDGDGGDLLDHVRRSMKIDQALVDAHFKTIPSVGTLSRRSLTGSDTKDLGGKTDRSAHMELLIQGSLLQVGADLFKVGDIATGQSDANAVDNLVRWGGASFFLGRKRHDVE